MATENVASKCAIVFSSPTRGYLKVPVGYAEGRVEVVVVGGDRFWAPRGDERRSINTSN